MRRTLIVCLLWLLAYVAIALAQSGPYDAILQDGDQIAADGDAAPGGGSYTGFIHVDAGDAGDVVFAAAVAGGSASEGLFRIAGGVSSVLALRGQAAPSTAPGTYQSFGTLDVNDVGAVAFGASIDHLIGADTTAVFVNASGVTTLVAESGQLAPGAFGATFAGFGTPAINDAGSVAFTAALDDGGSGLFLSVGGVVAPIALNSDALPIGGVYGAFYAFDLDDAGRVWFISGGAGNVILVSDAGVETALLLQGDATPIGGTYSGFRAISASAAGALAFQSTVAGGSAPSAMFLRAPGGSITAPVVQGGAAPGTGGGSFNSLFPELSVPTLNDGGDLVFAANVFGGTTSSGIFRLPAGGALEPVAVAGATVPSLPTSIYQSFTPPSLDDDGETAYRAELFANTDSDGDGYVFLEDNCLVIPNPTQCDTDMDGFGNHCDGDFDNNKVPGAVDFSTRFVPDYKKGADLPPLDGTDMDCNGSVNAVDFSTRFVPLFKKGLTGPSGLECAGTIPCPPDL